MPNEYKLYLDKLGLNYQESKDFNDSITSADIIYMTRVQKERFSDPIEYERTKNAYVLKNEMLLGCKKSMRVLHPLPRVNEIDKDVDNSAFAYYFEQTENGVYIRQAIIALIMGCK
jgi:aspartate carbamoyltransferase catalytic subunit